MDKQELLDYLADAGEAGIADVTSALGVTPPAAGMALLRLLRQGLIARYLDPHRPNYWYALTPKGRARLDYFAKPD